MKIQCDVCEKDEASLFCTADEAALCSACDHRVHHANKVAGKHQRFSLNNPSHQQAPLCDICQERQGFLFCQQDRAILCSECDIPINKANEHTKNHTRFLLTGIKLSATPTLYSSASSDAVPNIQKPADSKRTEVICLIAPTCTTCTDSGTTVESTTVHSNTNVQLTNGGTISASSISEYLETLPGWHVEDFLDSPFGFSKNMENEVLSFWDHADFQNNVISAFPSEKMGFSVPQVEPHLQQTYQSLEMTFGFANGFIEHSKEFTINNNNYLNNNNNNIKSTRKISEDNSFVVPQIIPHSSVSKISRTFY